MERQFLTSALAEADWNDTQAARMLGLSRDTLRYRMEKYDIRVR
jgi:transcriptional regulator with GAF, ATPase, and Fis domain